VVRLARLLPGGRAETLTLAEWVEEYLGAHQGERVTIAKLRWLLGKATATLGEVCLAELSPDQVSAWRLTVPEGHRFEATQALRQVLNRAVAWKLIDDNPAKRVPNPARRCREQRPFESWQQVRSLAEHLGPTHGSMVLFAAATGLRPSELFALEQRDIDRGAGVVQIRRGYANGRVKHTKTRLSSRAVPLQRIALEALYQLPKPKDSPLSSSRTLTAATSTSATSTAAIGSPSRKQPGSTRCAISTTCATRMPPSRSAPGSPCLPCRGSWARASQ